MYKRKPDWLKIKLKSGKDIHYVERLLEDLHLNSVCSAAKCPNRAECYSNRTATFMILGKTCTRSCLFCNITSGLPESVDTMEPEHIARAVESLNLRYVVVTSVTRDDLLDGGAEHFYNVTKAIKYSNLSTDVELLIPDFAGADSGLKRVMEAKPTVINHNMESVKRLYCRVRPEADYNRSLHLLSSVKKESNIIAKTGIILGMGEKDSEVKELLKDIYDTGCDLLTIGQYLAPSKEHLVVDRYVTPKAFEEWKSYALDLGFKGVASGPLVRSSYHARSLKCSI